MTLENDLKRALRRQAPPAGFAGRVMQRIESEVPRSSSGSSEFLGENSPEEHRGTPRHPRNSRPVWWRAAAASVTLAVLLGGYATHRVVEHRRGERAKEQVLTAMRIAGEKVRYAQQEVRGIGSAE
jgi:hypothetical protein